MNNKDKFSKSYQKMELNITESNNLNVLHNQSRYTSYLRLSDDVWDAASLGLEIYEYNSISKLVFTHIHPNLFKELAKKFIRYQSTINKLSTLQGHIRNFNKFSDFLLEFYPHLNFYKLDRKVILNFINWMSNRKYTWATKSNCLSSLKKFFRVSSINKWLDFPDYLIHQEDWGKRPEPIPRYIPEEVIRQLNQHLDNFPAPIMRMVLVLEECGLRIGELCLLPINCLNQDSKGDWYIRFMRWKMEKETNIPISHELAKVIQEQQQYIQKYLDKNFNYLFCGGIYRCKKDNSFSPKPKIMLSATFSKYLKDFACNFDIKDDLGKIWNFQTHQFRHTVGTRMINNGVPHHIVQRYLGHTSPKMTMTYAYIYDETLKKEIVKYHDNRVVNIIGEVIESENPELDNDLDLHLLRKKILAQSLSNGSCARPIQLGDCPHANACLTCGDFRTTIEFLEQHKIQLEETKKILKNAEEKGWERQAEMNKKVKNNLERIINTLENRDKEIISKLEK